MSDYHDQLGGVFGDQPRYSEHKEGELVTYRNDVGEVRSGRIMYVIAPTQKGPLTYMIESGRGWPDAVAQGSIIVGRICPSCGLSYTGVPATSRADNETPICPDCGTKEALADFQSFLERQRDI